MSGRPRPLAIVGPTASGKTAVAVAVARMIRGEVVSMDSRQVYRGMDIGTAKPSQEEREGVPHHGFDLANPDDRFSAGRFARYAREVLEDVRARGLTPILAGGTGFFLRALTDPIFRQPDLPVEQRAALLQHLERNSDETLRRWLGRLDPPMAERYASWGGRQRLLRALEMPLLTGRPLSWWQAEAPREAAPIDPRIFVLDCPREILVERIERRAHAMVEDGLVAEARDLVERFGADAPGLKAHGYMEIVPYLRGEVSLDEAVEAIVIDTRRYARRQRTWFRHQLPDDSTWLDATRPAPELAAEIVASAESNP